MSDESTYLKIHDRTYSLEQVMGAMRLSGAWAKAAKDFIRGEVIHLLAGEGGITVSDEELQTAIDASRKLSGLYKADDARTWLATIGQTLEDLEHQQEGALIEHKLVEAIEKDRVEKFFDDNRAGFDAVRVSMLQTEDEGVAKEFAQQIEEGEATFEDLAKQHSTHAESRSVGGHLGWRRRGALPQEAADRLFSSEAGGVVGPVSAEGTYQLFRIDEVKLASELTAGVEGEIRKGLLDQDIATFLQQKGIEENAPWKKDPAAVG